MRVVLRVSMRLDVDKPVNGGNSDDIAQALAEAIDEQLTEWWVTDDNNDEYHVEAVDTVVAVLEANA